MKIGIFTDPIDRGAGSVSIFIENLVRNLIKITNKMNDTDIVLIHSIQNDHPIYNRKEKLTVFPSLKKKWENLNFFEKISLHLKFYNKIMSLANKKNIDVLHFPQFVATGSPPLNFGNPYDIKLIATIHGAQPLVISPREYPYLGYKFLLDVFYSWRGLLKWKMKFKRMFNEIVTISHSAKKELSNVLNLPSESINVIYHGVNNNFNTLISQKDAFEHIYNKYEIKNPFVFHVSNHHPIKNVIRLIDAFQKLKLKGYQLVIAGNGKATEYLVRYTRSKKMENIAFVGYIPHNELPLFYRASEVFVLPSLRESFGMPLLEAMACGTPVVTSDRYSMAEIANGAAYLVNPYNVDEITNAIFTLLVESSLREKLIQRELKQAKKFSWECTAREYLKIYKRACEKKF